MIIFLYLLVGAYLGIASLVFIFFFFLVILGGKQSDLWFPFVIAPLWPMFLIVYFVTKGKR